MQIDFTKFDRCHILVVGDLMVDEYLWGDVDRTSPEAPVQVVAVKTEDCTLGGAGNVVNNIAALGAKVSVAGVIGTGRNGQLLMEMFDRIGADTGGIFQEPGRPTTVKTRVIAANQHVVRIDRETKKAVSEETFDRLANYLEAKVALVDVVLISDYGKGIITKPLLSRLTAAAREHNKMTIADPKGLDFSKYSRVSLLTPNRKEAALAAGMEIADQTTLAEAANKILEAVDIGSLLITCGQDGMVLFRRHQAPYQISAQARQVFDVSGAGDTVLAVVGLAIAAGESFENAITLANTAAGIVVEHVGTAAVSKQQLAAVLNRTMDNTAFKQKHKSDLPALIRKLKTEGKRIVMTNGCFDILHTGHILLFSASKKLGDVLIVAMDDDASVKALKGPGRPVISARERVRILSALDTVDYVVIFSSEELKSLIEIIRPDILTKGSNYATEEVQGRELVEQLGGKVTLIPVTEDISSTRIINNIKNSGSD